MKEADDADLIAELLWRRRLKEFHSVDPSFRGIIDGLQARFRSQRGLLEATPGYDQIDPRRLLQLEPPKKKSLLPVVWWKHRRSSSGLESISLVAFLFSREKEKIRAIGFRFEPGEGGGQLGDPHAHHHVQLCRTLRKGTPDPLFDALKVKVLPVPFDYPAIPVDASCPLSLVLSFLIALYGPDEVIIEAMTLPAHNHQARRKRVAEVVQRMSLYQVGPLKEKLQKHFPRPGTCQQP